MFRPILLTILLCVWTAGQTLTMSLPFEEETALLENAGLERAILAIHYGLSDDCDLVDVTLASAEPPDLFGHKTIEKLVKYMIGPFEPFRINTIWDQTTPTFPWDEEKLFSRGIRWPTTDGSLYIECFFNKNGGFMFAEYVAPNVAPAPTAPKVRIESPLSSLGFNELRFMFTVPSSH